MSRRAGAGMLPVGPNLSEAVMRSYPPIADHGLIGDLQTSALVSLDGTVDWFCHPRFDSPSVFASLLDAERGGYFQIAPETTDYVSRQLYLPGTAILITRFMTPDGVGEVLDFMPVAGKRVTDRHAIVRLIRVVRGSMRFVIDCQPRFDYGRSPHKTDITSDGVAFHGDDGTTITVSVLRRAGHEQSPVPIRHAGDGARAVVDAQAGEVGGVLLETGGDGRPRNLSAEEVLALQAQTRDFWRAWIGR